MPGVQVAVARATAAVFAGGRRAGSAVLVTTRHLITAAHVLANQDQVELEFPAARLSQPSIRLTASRLDAVASDAESDVVVLDLGDDRLAWLPTPVPLWPAARPPDKVRVFGYPLAEGSLNGVWRRFDVAGTAAGGSVQLDWPGDVGTFPGHSGGPVIDVGEGALAGILIEGAERGRFDRYLPVTLIANAWPQLPKPWLVTGADQGEGRSHYTRRSRGQRSAARGGDLFCGRQNALALVSGWLTADEPPGLPLVVTGQPGAGKSAVLARAALGVEADSGGPGLAFHARAATIGHFMDALAALVGVDSPRVADELVTSLADLPAGPPIPVAVDALDEAASDQDRRQIAEALTELALLPGLRVAVATRPLAAGDPYAPGGLIRALGVIGPSAPNLIDLDDDAHFDLESLREFAAALLAQDGMERPGPPGAAWARYRALPAARSRLATVIAERARRNFLVAAMAAVPLSIAQEITDPAARGFNPASIPSGIGEALGKYLDQLPQQRREHDRALLTALAYARGAGLDDPTWLAFAAALGYNAAVADLDALRHSAAADYLLQTTATERAARPLTRLFHQALTDELLAARHQPSDESQLLDTLLSLAGRTGWQDRYAHDHAAEYASAAGRLDELLDDPFYLVAVDPTRLVPYLDTARSAAARSAAAVYRQTAHHLAALDGPMRASQLELTAHQFGARSLAARIAATTPDRPWQTRWFHGHRATGHQVLTGHVLGVSAVAVGALPDGTPVAVSGGGDGAVRVWRLADGSPVGEPLTGHDGGVAAVAVGALADGTPVVVSGGRDGTVRVWRLADGSPVGEPLRDEGKVAAAVRVVRLGDGILMGKPPRMGGRALAGEPLHSHRRGVAAVAVSALADGTPVVVSGGRDGIVLVRRLGDGTLVGKPLRSLGLGVAAVAVGALPDGTPVMVSGDGDGEVRVWRLANGRPVGEPMRSLGLGVAAVAVGALADGTPVVVSGGYSGTVEAWRLADGSRVVKPLYGNRGRADAMAVGSLADGTPVVVGGGDDGAVRVWRLADGTLVGEPLRGHDGPVTAVAAGVLPDGTSAVVSGGADGTVRVWRLADDAPAIDAPRSRESFAAALAVSALADGTPVVVSGGDDGTVRVWRLADGSPVGEPLTGHNGPVAAVAAEVLPDGALVVVSGGDDGTVRVWRLADGSPLGEPLAGHVGRVFAVAVGSLADGTPVAVSGGRDGTVRVWRLADGSPLGEPLTGHDGTVEAVVVAVLPDGTPVLVSGGADQAIRVWRLADGSPVGQPLTGHVGTVFAVAVGALPDGTPVLVSGGADQTVRVWRLTDGATVGEPVRGHESLVLAVAVGALADGTPVVVSGGGDGMVRMWQLSHGTPLVPPLNQSQTVMGVVMHGNVIVSLAGGDIAVNQPALGPMGFPRNVGTSP